jgi:hypothetical protein
VRVHDHRRQQTGGHRLFSKFGKGQDPRDRKTVALSEVLAAKQG